MKMHNVEVENKEPGIRIVRINRPDALNALNGETLHELRDVLKDAAREDSVRVLILTGMGEKAFVAGADIKEMASKTQSEAIAFSKLGQDVTKLLEYMNKPTIAAVNGYALGGGTEMAIACDFIFASENAVFGQPEVGLGIIPGFGGTSRLAKFVGWPMAKDLIFSGRKVKADEALRIGLVNRLLPIKDLMSETLKYAEMVAKNSLTAIREAKQLLNDFSESTGMNSKLDAEAMMFGKLFESHDQKEGMKAFTEKREAVFKGLKK